MIKVQTSLLLRGSLLAASLFLILIGVSLPQFKLRIHPVRGGVEP